MIEHAHFTALLEKLGSGDSRSEAARKEILALGSEAVAPLYIEHFKQEGEIYIEIYRILAEIGDAVFQEQGAAGIHQDIIKAMGSGAKKLRSWAPEEIQSISREALARWGLEVPQEIHQPVLSCHVCGAANTQERVMVCSLYSCENAVCREHTHILGTRFGQFEGSGGAWFCTGEHYRHANHHPQDWA